MNTTQSSTHSLSLRTQQVHIAIKQRLIISRGGSIDNHLASAIALWLVLLHNLSPQQACGTELSYFHEVVLAHAHIKLDALGSQVNIDTSISQLLQVLVTPSQRIAQLLNDVSTSIVECIAMNHDATEVRIVLERLGQLRSEGQYGRYILALEHHLLHRVPLDRAHYLLLVVALLLPVTLQNLSQLERVALTSHEVHLDTFAIDVLEQRFNSTHRHQLARHLETNGVDTLVQNVKCFGISSLGVFDHNVLTNIPLVRILLVTTHEWEFAR